MQFILLRRRGFPFSRPFHSHHLVAMTTRERNTVTATVRMKTWSFTSMTTRMNYIVTSQPWATPQICHPLQVAVIVINILNFDFHSSPSSNNIVINLVHHT